MLEGHVALLSGVGPGLGRDTALVFAREGARLILAARDEVRLGDVADEVRAAGGTVVAVPTDITDPSACAATVARGLEEFGAIDSLVNLAFKESVWKSLAESSPDLAEWRPAFDVNFFGTLTMTRAVVPHFVSRGRGVVVMVNSSASEGLMPKIGDYTGAKAALAAVTRTLALELGPHGIRVNGIHPGTMWGPFNKQRFARTAEAEGVTTEEVYDRAAAATPLRYLPGSIEVAEVLAFFASDRARVVTGQSLHANVGQIFG